MADGTFTDDADTEIRAAQQLLEQQASRLAAVGDPIAPMVAAFSVAVAAQHRLAVDLMSTAREPFSQPDRAALEARLLAAVSKGAIEGARGQARYLGDKINRRLAVQIGLAVALAFIAGCGFSALALSTMTGTGQPVMWDAADLSAQCADPANHFQTQDGGVACRMNAWIKPPAK